MQYYIVFRDTSHKLLKRILKNGFQHCFVLAKDEYSWFSIESTLNGMKFIPLAYESNTDVAAQYAEHYTVIPYVVCNNRHNIPYVVPSLINCVTITKHVIGLRGFRSAFILTPRQLYNYIKKVNLC